MGGIFVKTEPVESVSAGNGGAAACVNSVGEGRKYAISGPVGTSAHTQPCGDPTTVPEAAAAAAAAAAAVAQKGGSCSVGDQVRRKYPKIRLAATAPPDLPTNLLQGQQQQQPQLQPQQRSGEHGHELGRPQQHGCAKCRFALSGCRTCKSKGFKVTELCLKRRLECREARGGLQAQGRQPSQKQQTQKPPPQQQQQQQQTRQCVNAHSIAVAPSFARGCKRSLAQDAAPTGSAVLSFPGPSSSLAQPPASFAPSRARQQYPTGSAVMLEGPEQGSQPQPASKVQRTGPFGYSR